MRDTIFISYCPEDEAWYDRLLKALAPIEKSNGLKLWSKKNVKPGLKLSQEIEKAQGLAKVVVVLVSSSLLASDDIMDKELQPLVEAARKESISILWVPLEFTNYENTWLNDLKPVLPANKPLKGMTGAKISEAIINISQAISNAWLAPGWAGSLPNDETALSAIHMLKELADQYTYLTPAVVNECFRQACSDCYGLNGIIDHYPNLPIQKTFSWEVLLDHFGSAARLDQALVDLFSKSLAKGGRPVSVTDDRSRNSYLALIIRDSGQKNGVDKIYEWRAFVWDGDVPGYRSVSQGELDDTRGMMIFSPSSGSEANAGKILSKLIAWAQVNTSLPILEIYAPVELLDQDWSALMVEDEMGDEVALLKTQPYLLRPVERLNPRFNSKRENLRNKMHNLLNGKGRWKPSNGASDAQEIGATVVENEEIVGIKLIDSLPPDHNNRSALFKGVVLSMVPIALWWQCGSSATAEERTQELSSIGIQSEHDDNLSVLPGCGEFHALARRRKEHLLSALLLLVDHPDRAPESATPIEGAKPVISA